MKLNFAGPVVVVAVALYTVTSLAAECRVAIPYYPQGKIETPYSGGCKGGMADGTGKYSFSVVDKDTNTTVVTKVSGTFSNGKINGEGRLVSSNGSWEVGTYQEGNRWNITSVGFTKGVRFGTIFRDGKQVALCREDIEQPRCPPELKKALGGAPVMVSASQTEKRTSTVQTLNLGPSIQSNSGKDGNVARSQTVASNRPNVPNPDDPSGMDKCAYDAQDRLLAGAAREKFLRDCRNSNKTKKDEGPWDSWLEATGNKAKVAPQIATSAIKITGSAPAQLETVIKVCQHLVNATGPGGPGIGSIFAIDYLAPVDASTVYGNMGPQGKLVPLKLYAKYRDGEKLYANGYLQKDPFGDLKCIKSQ